MLWSTQKLIKPSQSGLDTWPWIMYFPIVCSRKSGTTSIEGAEAETMAMRSHTDTPHSFPLLRILVPWRAPYAGSGGGRIIVSSHLVLGKSGSSAHQAFGFTTAHCLVCSIKQLSWSERVNIGRC